MQKDMVCIYHADCVDGFTAWWAVSLKFLDRVEGVPASYGSEPPDVAGKEVIIVDFSYPRKVIEEMCRVAKSVVVIDHHKTAIEDLRGLSAPNLELVLDETRSGAMLAWLRYHKYKVKVNQFYADSPLLVRYVEDRDLWAWKMKFSREVNALIGSYEMTLGNWDQLRARLDDTRRNGRTFGEGAAIIADQEKKVGIIVKQAWRGKVGGHEVPVANCPHFMASEVGNRLSKGELFAATYHDMPGWRVWSLRSQKDGMDVSEVAKRLGGGGHKHAAGFREKR